VNPRRTTFAALLIAGLVLVGFAGRSTPETGSHGPLLISSTIGGASAFLFVVDPATRNLAVYEAMPGESGGLRLLGARKIEQDLELKKFRDLSAYSAEELLRMKGAAGNEAESSNDGKRDGS
jgi:hypothetical protein